MKPTFSDTKTTLRESEKPKEIEVKRHTAHVCSYSSKFNKETSYQLNKLQRLHKTRDAKLKRIFKKADQIDLPLNIAITISWDALIQAGERNEGHLLGGCHKKRQAKLFRRFRHLSNSRGRNLSYVWVSDFGARFGEHLHLALFWPRYDIETLLFLCVAVFGSKLDDTWDGHPKSFRSVCGGWMVRFAEPRPDMRYGWAAYMSDQVLKHNAHPGGRRFGCSRNLK